MMLLICTTAVTEIEAQRRRRSSGTNTPQVQKLDTTQFTGMKWRNIGPFRGGRSVAVSGIPGDPMTYLMGGTGGGIWKTTDAGLNWQNISDGYLKTGSVGEIAVSTSDPNVIYVGMGEHAVRGVMTSYGDGVYRSNDSGKTWEHLGLELTRHISDIIIHPDNPEIVYVAAQGAVHGPTNERGIYKSTDGGKTWRKTLFVNQNTGASGLSMDKTNPRILYAAMWDHQRLPWYVRSGGPGSGLYKSVDAGETWEKLEDGLPKEMGKTAISVSPVDPERVFAVIEAKEGGVFRSDNAGKSWRRTSGDRATITRAWYYTEVFADPVNEEIVYVLNAQALRSIDGGASFRPMPVGHGDTHDLWINPDNNSNFILGDDGGAEITFNSGKTWSSLENQPTAQFYRVNADKLFPYNVYGGQQDNSSVIISSAAIRGSIGWKNWRPGPGCESAYLAFDPENPRYVYGGCYQGNISLLDTKTNVSRDIMQYPYLGLGSTPVDLKYRFNWNAPIIASIHDSKTIYHAGNVLFKTTDMGTNWEAISGDLTQNDKKQQIQGGGPITNEGAGGENYNTIMYVAESPHAQGTLWVGSDDGLLHVTTDEGKNWQNVTPPGLNNAMINAIEVSPHRPNTVFVVATRYKFNDFSPMIFKSDDMGSSWKRINNGIGKYDFARVVREDPRVQGILYAGTETGIYLSTDDGSNWTKWQLNLPVVPVNDLIIRENDLVAATAGRSFWILDDLSPVQEGKGKLESLSLFNPEPVVRVNGYSSNSAPRGAGQSPLGGSIITYYLPEKMDSSEITLEIIRGDELIRKVSNQKDKSYKPYPGGPPPPAVLTSNKGVNRFAWDFRRDYIPNVPQVFVLGDYRGYRVAPGNYTAKLTVDGESFSTEFKVLKDPREDFSDNDYNEQEAMLKEIVSTVADIHSSVHQMREVRDQVNKYAGLYGDVEKADTLISLGEEILSDISDWENELVQPKQKTFQDVINFPNQLNSELLNLKDRVDTDYPVITSGARERLADLQKEWSGLSDKMDTIVERLNDYNELYRSLALPAIKMDFKGN